MCEIQNANLHFHRRGSSTANRTVVRKEVQSMIGPIIGAIIGSATMLSIVILRAAIIVDRRLGRIEERLLVLEKLAGTAVSNAER